jgi:hypothetical protein
MVPSIVSFDGKKYPQAMAAVFAVMICGFDHFIKSLLVCKKSRCRSFRHVPHQSSTCARE